VKKNKVIMKNIESTKIAAELLEILLQILTSQRENNWRKGIVAAAAELKNSDGTFNANGFDDARSIYTSITTGGRGFAEYYIWSDDEDERIESNKSLDSIRLQLWNIFSSEK
jgi:hypothetical protein